MSIKLKILDKTPHLKYKYVSNFIDVSKFNKVKLFKTQKQFKNN